MEQLPTLDDAERMAESVVAPEAWSYIVGGAGDERTLKWNRAAFSRYRLRPRVLVDVSTVTTETTVLGTPVSMPVLVAPMAFQQIAHEEGELAMARGAAAAETLMCLSTVATATPADIAAAAPQHFTMITPYENVTGGEPRFLHLYELDTDDPEPAFQAMTPATKARGDAGGWGSHPFDEWAWHPDLVIDFVSTFRREGSVP